MQTRHRAAATALLLTATAGLAAAGGTTAQAAGTHTSHRAHAPLVVTIKSKASGPTLSDDTFRPGHTVFKVKRVDDGGLMQVFRLKPGYTILDASNDFNLAFPPDQTTPPDVDAVNRIDDNVVFYGGARALPKNAAPMKWAVDIDHAGTYYVLNIERNTPPVTFTVKGQRQKRPMPAADGTLNMATAADGVTNVWKPGKHNAASGWMSSTNKAKEPHFVVLDHVKKSTTLKQVQKCFQGTGPCDFRAKDRAGIDTGVVSPHHTFLWTYDLPKGKFLAQCFWPSKMDGTPHAFMGMLAFMHLG